MAGGLLVGLDCGYRWGYLRLFIIGCSSGRIRGSLISMMKRLRRIIIIVLGKINFLENEENFNCDVLNNNKITLLCFLFEFNNKKYY